MKCLWMKLKKYIKSTETVELLSSSVQFIRFSSRFSFSHLIWLSWSIYKVFFLYFFSFAFKTNSFRFHFNNRTVKFQCNTCHLTILSKSENWNTSEHIWVSFSLNWNPLSFSHFRLFVFILLFPFPFFFSSIFEIFTLMLLCPPTDIITML